MIDRSAARSDMRAEGCAPVAVAPFAGFGPIVVALARARRGAPQTSAERCAATRSAMRESALAATRAERQRAHDRTVSTREAHDRAVLGGVYRGD